MSLENVGAVEEIFAHPSEMDQLVTRDGVDVATYDHLQAYLTGTLSRLEDHSITIDTLVVDGQEAMIRWELAGRLSKELFGIPATAESFETAGVTSVRVADGEIVEIHDHVNLLDLMPEVAREARQGIVREMRDGIVVIDEDDRIVDVNPAASETFGRHREDLLGASVETLLGADAEVPAAGESTLLTGPDGRRYYRVEASPLSGGDGDLIGRTLVLREVTEQRRHVQQLKVLNRVLRHNLRNDLTVVKGVLNTVDTEQVSDAATLAMAREKAEELLATADTARRIREMLDEFEMETHDIATTFDRLHRRTRAEHPDATVRTDVPEPLSVRATGVLSEALWELLENACEHAGPEPTVNLSVERRGETAVITVRDDGPGLPDHERRVLEGGEETDLEHGSGLGLWVANWVVAASGGDLSIESGDGTAIRATLPLADGE